MGDIVTSRCRAAFAPRQPRIPLEQLCPQCIVLIAHAKGRARRLTLDIRTGARADHSFFTASVMFATLDPGFVPS